MTLKKLGGLFIAITAAMLTAKSAYADERFDTSYNIKYTIQPSGETWVEQKIAITNKENDILATTYSHIIQHLDVYDVTGRDRQGTLEIETTSDKETTTIKATLNEQVIGKDRSNEITLAYKTRDIATKVGEIWNINLPQVEGIDSIKEYNVEISIPKAFGPQIFLSPTPVEQSTEGDYNLYKFDKIALSNKGITAAMGTHQIINFKIKYQLINDRWLPTRQEIALPPDILKVQQVLYTRLNPTPERIYTDKDGNLLASYKLGSHKTLEIELMGSAKILGRQIQPEEGGKMHEIPKKLSRAYTIAQPFWEVDSPQIQDLANKLFDPQKTVSQNAYAVYDYITQHLKYNMDATKSDTIERKGAITALDLEETSACMEFTDLFIALTRAMGIPARELNGYAFANAENIIPVSIDFKNSDTLHAWAEFYDPAFGWVQVDPTWGTTSGIDYFTKLDTNHFAFVVKGLDSEYPLPAGSYKTDESEKQIETDFAQDQVEFNVKLILHKKLNLNPIGLIKREKKYTIENQGGIIVYDLNHTGKTLLPFEKSNLRLPKNTSEIDFTDINGAQITQKISFGKSYVPTQLALLLGFILAMGSLAAIVVTKVIRKRQPELI